jgi:signal peptidase II
MLTQLSRKARIFWPVLLTVFLADCATKELVVEELATAGTSHAVFGDVVRLTLSYNVGAAMGLPIGGVGTVVLGLISLVVALVILAWYVRLPRDARLPAAALALVLAGALGNGIERVFSGRGVVDFIDVGLGTHRFYIFNVADIGVTIGALLLALWFWREDRRPTLSPDTP